MNCAYITPCNERCCSKIRLFKDYLNQFQYMDKYIVLNFISLKKDIFFSPLPHLMMLSEVEAHKVDKGIKEVEN